MFAEETDIMKTQQRLK